MGLFCSAMFNRLQPKVGWAMDAPRRPLSVIVPQLLPLLSPIMYGTKAALSLEGPDKLLVGRGADTAAGGGGGGVGGVGCFGGCVGWAGCKAVSGAGAVP